MTFAEFYILTNNKSDKGPDGNNLIDLFYSNEFTPIRFEKLNIVEIGVFRGDSMILLRDWFINSNITGIDNACGMNLNELEFVNSIENINFILDNSHNEIVINSFEDNSIDYLIDDGDHNLDSQIKTIKEYYPKLKKGGKLIVEDVQNFDSDRHYFDEIGIEYELIGYQEVPQPLLIFKK